MLLITAFKGKRNGTPVSVKITNKEPMGKGERERLGVLLDDVTMMIYSYAKIVNALQSGKELGCKNYNASNEH